MTIVRVGTASWSDPGFVTDWYPQSVSAAERLSWYARHFDLVEVNSSFYAIPNAMMTERWVRQTPDDFVFDVKLHKYLSRHATNPVLLPKDLRERAEIDRDRVVFSSILEEEVTHRFLQGIEPLREAGKLGALLLQLAPSFDPVTHDLAELDPLLKMLRGYRVAVELRNRAWTEPERLYQTLGYFVRRKITFVSVDVPDTDHVTVMPRITALTNPALGYFRAHGRNAHGFVTGKSTAERFDHRYVQKELREIKSRIEEMRVQADEIHVLFNNNSSDYAPTAAQSLLKMLGEQRSRREIQSPVQVGMRF